MGICVRVYKSNTPDSDSEATVGDRFSAQNIQHLHEVWTVSRNWHRAAGSCHLDAFGQVSSAEFLTLHSETGGRIQWDFFTIILHLFSQMKSFMDPKD